MLGHVANGRHRPSIIVIAFDAPRRNRRVVHGPSEREVGFYRELQFIDDRPLSAPSALEFGVVHDVIQNGEPMAWRRFAVRSICPKFGKASGVIPTGYQLRFIWLSSVGIQIVSGVHSTTIEKIVVLLEFVWIRCE